MGDMRITYLSVVSWIGSSAALAALLIGVWTLLFGFVKQEVELSQRGHHHSPMPPPYQPPTAIDCSIEAARLEILTTSAEGWQNN